jgi:hypothetical protein
MDNVKPSLYLVATDDAGTEPGAGNETNGPGSEPGAGNETNGAGLEPGAGYVTYGAVTEPEPEAGARQGMWVRSLERGRDRRCRY